MSVICSMSVIFGTYVCTNVRVSLDYIQKKNWKKALSLFLFPPLLFSISLKHSTVPVIFDYPKPKTKQQRSKKKIAAC